jgi:hypothetical protein
MIVQTHRYWLAQGHDIEQLKNAATEAVRDGGGMIDVVIVGNKIVSALISPGLPVLFESEEVDVDDRDTGDVGFPFDELSYGALDYP